MGKTIVFLFSGQGSQYYQMGSELYRHHPVFRHWMRHMDDYFIKMSGKSVIGELYENDNKTGAMFDRLLFTHPAIFMVEFALAQVFIEYRIYPDYVLGTSMGEFAACSVAGVVDYKAALESLVVQAGLVQEHCEPGGLIAVLEHASLYEAEPSFYRNSELASVNYDNHFVVSGGAERLFEVERYLRERAIFYQRLPINYGFHSRWIDAAALPFSRFLDSLSLHFPHTAIISGLRGGVCPSLESNYFWDVVREPINFRGALKSLMPEDDKIFIDLGPSGTLANFVKHNIRGLDSSAVQTVLTPFHKDMANLELTIERLHLKAT